MVASVGGGQLGRLEGPGVLFTSPRPQEQQACFHYFGQECLSLPPPGCPDHPSGEGVSPLPIGPPPPAQEGGPGGGMSAGEGGVTLVQKESLQDDWVSHLSALPLSDFTYFSVVSPLTCNLGESKQFKKLGGQEDVFTKKAQTVTLNQAELESLWPCGLGWVTRSPGCSLATQGIVGTCKRGLDVYSTSIKKLGQIALPLNLIS